MKVSKTIDYYLSYHKANSKKTTFKNCRHLINQFLAKFCTYDIEKITQEDVLNFLSDISSGKKQTTRFSYYSILSAYFSLIINSFDLEIVNLCKLPSIKKVFRRPRLTPWRILDKETVDEIIFRTLKKRDRLILELMARGGMRIGEVLKLSPKDLQDNKLVLRNPKSGRELEVVYLPRKLADRLRQYIMQIDTDTNNIFPISYVTAWKLVKKAGNRVGVKVSPHDFRRHAATFASRAGVPIEIVSKVILRHSDLSTTQHYLGKVSDIEASRWVENLHG